MAYRNNEINVMRNCIEDAKKVLRDFNIKNTLAVILVAVALYDKRLNDNNR